MPRRNNDGSSGSEAKLSDDQIESLVYQFLKRKGYTEVLEELKSRGDVSEQSVQGMVQEMESERRKEDEGRHALSLGTVLQQEQSDDEKKDKEWKGQAISLQSDEKTTTTTTTTSPSPPPSSSSTTATTTRGKIEEAYMELRRWVYASLDLYKNELIQVLWPVFVHAYLELVRKGRTEEAAGFLARQANEHRIFHEAEVGMLESVKTRYHMRQNQFVQQVTQNKFTIRLSQATHDLLMKFLQDTSSITLLAILNQYVTFNTFRRQPAIDAGPILDATLQVSAAKTGLFGSMSSLEPISWEAPPDEEDMMKQKEERRAKRGRRKESEIERERKIAKLKQAASKAPPMQPSVCLFTLFNSKHRVNCVDISKDGRSVCAGFADSTVRVWGNRTRREEMSDREQQHGDGGDEERLDHIRLTGHSGPVYGVSMSSDGEWVLSGGEDGMVRLWNVTGGVGRGRCMAVYRGHQYPVWDVQFSPFNYYFVTASHDRTARLWSTDRISPLRVFAGHLSDVDCVQFHPNNNYVATGSADKTVRLWSVQSGECVRIFIGHHSAIHSLAFSRDGRFLASAAADHAIRIWDLSGTSTKPVARLMGHSDHIWSMDFATEGRQLVSGGADGTVRLWDMTLIRDAHHPDNANNNNNNAVRNKRGYVEASNENDSGSTMTKEGGKEGEENERGGGRGGKEDEGKHDEHGDERRTTGTRKRKRRRGMYGEEEDVPEYDALGTYYTKNTPLFRVRYIQRGLVLTSGPFMT